MTNVLRYFYIGRAFGSEVEPLTQMYSNLQSTDRIGNDFDY